MALVLFVIACGFVSAGLLNAIHLMIQGPQEELPPNGMVLYFDTPGAIAWSMFICMFAGPYLVISHGLKLWTAGHLPSPVVGFCCLISLVWSFCSGVFIVEVIHAAGFVVS